MNYFTNGAPYDTRVLILAKQLSVCAASGMSVDCLWGTYHFDNPLQIFYFFVSACVCEIICYCNIFFI